MYFIFRNGHYVSAVLYVHHFIAGPAFYGLHFILRNVSIFLAYFLKGNKILNTNLLSSNYCLGCAIIM